MIALEGHPLSTLRTSTVKIKGLKMMTGLAVGLFSLVQHPLRFQIIALFGLDLELKQIESYLRYLRAFINNNNRINNIATPCTCSSGSKFENFAGMTIAVIVLR